MPHAELYLYHCLGFSWQANPSVLNSKWERCDYGFSIIDLKIPSYIMYMHIYCNIYVNIRQSSFKISQLVPNQRRTPTLTLIHPRLRYFLD